MSRSGNQNPNLTDQKRRSLQALQDAYARLSRTILDYQGSGHEGRPCFEELKSRGKLDENLGNSPFRPSPHPEWAQPSSSLVCGLSGHDRHG